MPSCCCGRISASGSRPPGLNICPSTGHSRSADGYLWGPGARRSTREIARPSRRDATPKPTHREDGAMAALAKPLLLMLPPIDRHRNRGLLTQPDWAAPSASRAARRTSDPDASSSALDSWSAVSRASLKARSRRRGSGTFSALRRCTLRAAAPLHGRERGAFRSWGLPRGRQRGGVDAIAAAAPSGRGAANIVAVSRDPGPRGRRRRRLEGTAGAPAAVASRADCASPSRAWSGWTAPRRVRRAGPRLPLPRRAPSHLALDAAGLPCRPGRDKHLPARIIDIPSTAYLERAYDDASTERRVASVHGHRHPAGRTRRAPPGRNTMSCAGSTHRRNGR